jgi:hypothetical protein
MIEAADGDTCPFVVQPWQHAQGVCPEQIDSDLDECESVEWQCTAQAFVCLNMCGVGKRLGGVDMANELPASDESPFARGARGEAMARSATDLAILGRGQDASLILEELRASFVSGQYPRVSIRILALDGIIHYYRDRSIESFDRMRRANVLARSAGYMDLTAETAVWMAHFAFNFEKYTFLSQSLSEALRGFHEMDETHRSRICLVIADSNQFLGNIEQAVKWYGCARIFARSAGSRAMIAAVEYNRIAMGLSRIRVERFLPMLRKSTPIFNWKLEIASIRNLHEGLEVTSLPELLLLCESYQAQAAGDYLRSYEVLLQIKGLGAAEICGVSNELLDLEILWARAMSGDSSRLSGYPLPSLDDISGWPIDEQAIGLVQAKDIYLIAKASFDIDRFEIMQKAVIDHCVESDRSLQVAIMSADKDFETVFGIAQGSRQFGVSS